ncbi:hypothetical protein ACHBTE_00220 [Streptomyces sp. M41]
MRILTLIRRRNGDLVLKTVNALVTPYVAAEVSRSSLAALRASSAPVRSS